MRHNWIYVGNAGNSGIYVDYRKRKTRIISSGLIYLHNGIYPYHNPICFRKYKAMVK